MIYRWRKPANVLHKKDYVMDTDDKKTMDPQGDPNAAKPEGWTDAEHAAILAGAQPGEGTAALQGTRQVTVIKPFTLSLDKTNEKVSYAPGIHVMPREVADHWFTQLHVQDGDVVENDDGTRAATKDDLNEGEVLVNILKPCTYTRADGTVLKLSVGPHAMSAEDANHWFIKHHSDDPPEPEVVPGTPQWADRERRKVARQHILDTAAEQAADTARAEKRDDNRDHPSDDDAAVETDTMTKPKVARRKAAATAE